MQKDLCHYQSRQFESLHYELKQQGGDTYPCCPDNYDAVNNCKIHFEHDFYLICLNVNGNEYNIKDIECQLLSIRITKTRTDVSSAHVLLSVNIKLYIEIPLLLVYT